MKHLLTYSIFVFCLTLFTACGQSNNAPTTSTNSVKQAVSNTTKQTENPQIKEGINAQKTPAKMNQNTVNLSKKAAIEKIKAQKRKVDSLKMIQR